jgi:hypothetical protein
MKNVLIKIDTKKTITIKDYLLELVSEKKYEDNYTNKKEDINSFIRSIVKEKNFNSMETTKYLTEFISNNDEIIQEQKRKLNDLLNKYTELENAYLIQKKKLGNL